MIYAKIKISGNMAHGRDLLPITSGTIGAEVSFDFDETWAGMTKTAVWVGSGVTVIDTTCSGVIPAEVVAVAGTRLRVGVYGTVGNTALPTVWADMGVVLRGACPSGDPSTDPSLPVWAQLQQQIQSLQKRLEELEKNCNGGGNGPGDDTGGEEVKKLDAPVIRLEAEAPKLAAPVITLETVSDDTEDTQTTPAILGVAVLGRTILGSYGGSIPKLTAPVISLETEDDSGELPKLDAPVIRLEADQEGTEEEPALTKLDTPVITLETVVMVLDAPEIQLVEV